LDDLLPPADTKSKPSRGAGRGQELENESLSFPIKISLIREGRVEETNMMEIIKPGNSDEPIERNNFTRGEK